MLVLESRDNKDILGTPGHLVRDSGACPALWHNKEGWPRANCPEGTPSGRLFEYFVQAAPWTDKEVGPETGRGLPCRSVAEPEQKHTSLHFKCTSLCSHLSSLQKSAFWTLSALSMEKTTGQTNPQSSEPVRCKVFFGEN